MKPEIYSAFRGTGRWQFVTGFECEISLGLHVLWKYVLVRTMPAFVVNEIVQKNVLPVTEPLFQHIVEQKNSEEQYTLCVVPNTRNCASMKGVGRSLPSDPTIKLTNVSYFFYLCLVGIIKQFCRVFMQRKLSSVCFQLLLSMRSQPKSISKANVKLEKARHTVGLMNLFAFMQFDVIWALWY